MILVRGLGLKDKFYDLFLSFIIIKCLGKIFKNNLESQQGKEVCDVIEINLKSNK